VRSVKSLDMYQKIVEIGNTFEIFTYGRDPSPKRFTSPKKTDENLRNYIRWLRDISDIPRVRYRRSIMRASFSFKRIVACQLSCGMPVLVSATVYRHVSIKTGYKYLTQFQQRLRYKYGKKIVCISVPEFQQRGTIHFHILIWGLPADVIYHEAPWESYQGSSNYQQKRRARFTEFCIKNGFQPTEARGQRSIQFLWRRGYLDSTPTDGSQKIIGYLSKYMRKAEGDPRLAGEKSYTTTRNVLRPRSYTSIDALKWDHEFEGRDINTFLTKKQLTIQYEKTYSTQWLGEATFRRYISLKNYG